MVSPSVPIDLGNGTTTPGTPTINLQPWQAVGVPFTPTASNPAPLILPASVIARLISPTTDTTTITPDRWGQVIQARDPLGHVTTIQRSGMFPTVVLYPDGSVDSASYTNSLVTTLRRAGHSTVHIHYGVYSQPDSIWGGGTAAQRIFLNNTNGNADSVRHAGPTPAVARFAYDALGRMSSYQDEAGHTTRYGYDAVWGNADSVTNAVGSLVYEILDVHGRTAVYADGLDNAITFAYDSLNRQVSAVQQYGSPVQTVYDGLLPTSVIDRNSNKTVTDYNALGWATDRCDPTSHCTYYRYDASGRLTGATNRRGQHINRTYDRLGRLLVKSGDSTTTDSFAYSADGRGVTAQNSIETDSLRVRPGTSLQGAADTVITHVNGTRFQVIHGDLGSWAGVDSTVMTTSAPGVTFRKRYRTADTTTGLVTSYNDGFNTMTYSYTSDWLQSAWTNATGTKNTTYLASHAVNYTTFSASSLGSLYRSQWYDQLLRPIQLFSSFGPGPYSGSQFMYDRNGRLVQTQILTGCATATHYVGSGTYYNNCSGISAPTVYYYDNEGNRTSQSGSYGVGNRTLALDGFTYTHDVDGNVIRKHNGAGEDHRYTWSADGRLTDVYFNDGLGDSPYTVHYDYNVYGEPVRRTLGTPDRVWLYDRGQLLGEFNAANGEQRVAEYLYNEDVDDPYAVVLGATTPTAIDYLEADQRGDVIGAYEGTTVTMSMNYGDWGVPSSGGGRQVGNVLWKGLHHDEYTGLYYMRARWYDPSSGRFLSEDPAGFAGGVNPYTFAGDDPINGFDPSGMHRSTLLGTVGGAICGIFCEFIGDVFASGRTSEPSVGHVPPLRGVNPGLSQGAGYTLTEGESCTVGYVATNVYFTGSGIHTKVNSVVPLSGLPDVGCSSDTYLVFSRDGVPSDYSLNFGGKHHGGSFHFELAFPFIQAFGYHVGLSSLDDLGWSISTPQFNIGPPASYACAKAGIGCTTP